MRQFLKSLFSGKKYLIVVSRGANISQAEVEAAVKNGGIVRADGSPHHAISLIEVQ